MPDAGKTEGGVLQYVYPDRLTETLWPGMGSKPFERSTPMLV